MNVIIDAIANMLPGIIAVAAVAGYQIVSDRATRRKFEKERRKWEVDE